MITIITLFYLKKVPRRSKEYYPFPKIAFMTQQLSSQQIFYDLFHKILSSTRDKKKSHNIRAEFYHPEDFLLLNSYNKHSSVLHAEGIIIIMILKSHVRGRRRK